MLGADEDSVPIGGSYRDPAGRVFERDGKLLRAVYAAGRDSELLLVKSEFIQDLVASKRLVAFRTAPVSEIAADPRTAAPISVFELTRLPFVSHPYEWSFAALKRAALFHLDLQLDALDHEIALVDASAYNVQFLGTEPIFIDHLSFRPYRDGEMWLGHRQFCEQFLHPLLFETSTGLPFNSWYRGSPEGISGTSLASVSPLRARIGPRMFLHVILPAFFDRKAAQSGAGSFKNRTFPLSGFRALLRGLRNWITSLRPKSDMSGIWATYEKNNTYLQGENEAKRAFIADFVAQSQPQTVWDLGCNTGAYAELALTHGASQVIGFDADPTVVDIAFQRAAERGLNFLPLVQDFQNPSPALGWRQSERDGFNERKTADGVLALALLHHLALGKNIPLEDAVDWVIGIAPRGILEFVPKSDPVVPLMLRNRIDIFENYTEDRFDNAVCRKARVVKEARITESGRKLVWFDTTE